VSDPTVNDLELEEVDEVSLVDRGANQYAKLLISKRAEEEEEDPVEKADPDPSSVHVEEPFGEEEEDADDEDDVKKGYFSRLIEKFFRESATRVPHNGTLPHMSDVQKAFPGQDPRLGMFGGQQPPLPPVQHPNFQVGTPAPGPQNAMPPGPGPQAFPAQDPMAGQMQAGPPLPDEVVQYIQQLEQALADAQGGNQQTSEEDDDVSGNQFGKSLGDLPDDEVTFLQELSKNLESEEVREEVSKAMEIVKAANARAEEAEKIAKAERDQRLVREFVAKAQSFTSLPINPETFGPVLKKLSEALSDEEYDAVTKALAAGNETMANASLFGEIGKRGGYQPTEAIAKVDTSAEEIAKAQNISIEAARTQVFESDPALYDQYLQETGR
jgi:hypothetical protein